jgi:hypothetical protein
MQELGRGARFARTVISNLRMSATGVVLVVLRRGRLTKSKGSSSTAAAIMLVGTGHTPVLPKKEAYPAPNRARTRTSLVAAATQQLRNSCATAAQSSSLRPPLASTFARDPICFSKDPKKSKEVQRSQKKSKERVTVGFFPKMSMGAPGTVRGGRSPTTPCARA